MFGLLRTPPSICWLIAEPCHVVDWHYTIWDRNVSGTSRAGVVYFTHVSKWPLPNIWLTAAHWPICLNVSAAHISATLQTLFFAASAASSFSYSSSTDFACSAFFSLSLCLFLSLSLSVPAGLSPIFNVNALVTLKSTGIVSFRHFVCPCIGY